MYRICVHAALVAAFLWLGDSVVADEPAKADLAFVTYIGDNSQEAPAAALAASIRKWGGEYADCPIFVVLVDPGVSGYRVKNFGVELISLGLPDEVSGYPFAWKAWAAARVEELTAGKFSTLVWLDPETMILRPPTAYDLKPGFGAAVAPVALINTGQADTEPVDAYWGPIYERCSLDMAKMFTVETKVDCKQVRAWLNCGMFSVRPDRGLFREWKQILGEFIADTLFQKTAVTDAVHRTFLHQAVISTLIVSRLERSEISMLPNDCNYPLFLHGLDFRTLSGKVYRMPEHKRVSKFSELTSVFLESFFEQHPDWIKYVPPVEEPMKSWLNDRYYDRFKIADRLYREENSCNSYLVTSSQGSVLIDPGGVSAPDGAFRQLVQTSPVKAILLTHSHEDHIHGIESWTSGVNIPVVGQREQAEFIAFNDRLAGFADRRAAIQSGTPLPTPGEPAPPTSVPATILFDHEYRYEFGDLHFEFFHVGGETPDQALIWIPELRALFIGDNYYTSFPNLSTLRGSPARPALEYLAVLEKALALEPEYLLPGHGFPEVGKGIVRQKLTKYRDALKFVHDAVVAGMNEGKSAYTLMQEITLPPELQLPQSFGRVSWAVRGIYDAYAGWFDENPASMYALPPSSIDSDLVSLCGVEALAKRASELVQGGDEVRALYMTEVILTAEPDNKAALEVRLSAMKALQTKSGNYIERNWLRYFIREIEEKLKGL